MAAFLLILPSDMRSDHSSLTYRIQLFVVWVHQHRPSLELIDFLGLLVSWVFCIGSRSAHSTGKRTLLQRVACFASRAFKRWLGYRLRACVTSTRPMPRAASPSRTRFRTPASAFGPTITSTTLGFRRG
jgi:hypothetical protein